MNINKNTNINKNKTDKQPRVLYCNCSYSSIIPTETKEEIQTALRHSDMDIIAVPDLCGLAAQRDPELEHIAASESLIIVACYPRAVRWLFHAANISLPETVKILNMRVQSIDEIKNILGAEKDNAGSNNDTIFPGKKEDEWIPWFPVIDYDRCKSCKQCASFCLFGAFEVTRDGKVVVSNPDHCKTNCPACARICPEAAIMFPKLEESPINGDEIRDEQETRALIKLNTDLMLGDDVYAALAERRRKAKHRLLKLKKNAEAQAYRERQTYIEKSQ
jgi:NAD-dependent dihydropyrimidine dehydrogenase PreA subunit